VLQLNDLKRVANDFAPYIWRTPVATTSIGGKRVSLKLESMQRGGSFKIRGALANLLNLKPDELKAGVVAVSGGNHAVAVALAAKLLGTSAKVVMPAELATPFRRAICAELGAHIELPSGRAQAFQSAKDIASKEGRFFVPPFDSLVTISATASIGLEILEQHPAVEEIFVAIGGGGLAAGIALAIKLLKPSVRVIGVEPAGADLMSRSIRANAVVRDENVSSIAEGLTPPFVGQLCLDVCKEHLDDVITVLDDEIRKSVRSLVYESKVYCEPSGAAALAGAVKLHKSLNEHIVCVVSGANIGPAQLATHVEG
jgi:threonine dehydratase